MSFFLLGVAKELYFNARNTCQHPTMAPRAEDANVTRSEVGLPMRPLQNLSRKTVGLKKQMKCAEKKKTKTIHNNQKIYFIICLKARIKYPLSGTQSSACFWQESSILTHAYHFPWSPGEPISALQSHRALAHLSKPSSTPGGTSEESLHGLAEGLRAEQYVHEGFPTLLPRGSSRMAWSSQQVTARRQETANSSQSESENV